MRFLLSITTLATTLATVAGAQDFAAALRSTPARLPKFVALRIQETR